MRKKKMISPYVFPGIRRGHLPDDIGDRSLSISPDEIMEIVAKETFVSVSDILSESRKSEVIIARHIFCGILKLEFNYSYVYIGELVKRDHTTIINAVKNYKSRKNLEENFRDKVQQVKLKINLK